MENGLKINLNNQEKDLLLQDLSSRLPYGVKIDIPDLFISTKNNIEVLNEIFCGDDGEFRCNDSGMLIKYVKPYLFPLSSITEEQMEELEELCNMYTPDDDYWPYAYKGITILYKHVLDDGYKFSSSFNTDVIDWFNKNHFDYRGLIPMGLANDATGLNIY